MARRIAGGPVPAAAAGLLALVVFAGFLGLTLTADRLLREGPVGTLLDPRALTPSVDLTAANTTLRRQLQSPSETLRRSGTLVRAGVAAFGGAIGPALVAAAIPAPVVAAVSAVEPAGTTFGDATKGKARSNRKGGKGSIAASGGREPSGSLGASSEGKEDSKAKGKAGESVAAAGGAERGPDKDPEKNFG